MNGKLMVAAFLASAFVASFAEADPTMSASVSGPNFAGNLEWQISIDPDENLFTDSEGDFPDQGVGGSLAVELAFDIDGSALVDAVVNTADWPYETVGFNPFTGGITGGLWIDEDNGLVVLFAAFASEFLTSPDPVVLLTLETEGTGPTTLRWGELASGDPYFGALIAQAGEEFYPQSGILSVVPEPTSIVLTGMAAAAVWFGRRRRR